MDLEDREWWSTNPRLRARVLAAITRAAVNVAAEDTTAEGYDIRRQRLAAEVLRNPDAWSRIYIHGVLTNANVGTGNSDPLTDDGALEYVVSSLWDAYAETVA